MSDAEALPVGAVRVDSPDPAFAVRGPYWRPGHSVAVEPWVVLVESGRGQHVVPCGRNAERARQLAGQLASRQCDNDGRLLGVVVIAPDGAPSHGWAAEAGAVPVPGAPAWSRLLRLSMPGPCPRCLTERWAGCWVGEAGCGACHDDGRPGWPDDPPPPPPPLAKRKVSAKRGGGDDRAGLDTPRLDTPGPDRLL